MIYKTYTRLIIFYLLIGLTASSILTKNLYASDSLTTYKRSAFSHWADFDLDCQTSRAETLIRYNMGVLRFKTDKKCLVTQGVWLCPYTGKVFYIAKKLDIDHVIPLKWAWEHGASEWSKEKRKQFANDPENLLAVELGANRRKSAQGPDTWQPSLVSFRAGYLVKWEYLKNKYGLK